jgi:hypothetical protein
MFNGFLKIVTALGLVSQAPIDNQNVVTTPVTTAQIVQSNDYGSSAYRRPVPVSGVENLHIVDLRPLRGMKLGNLNAWYVGIDGKAPKFEAINFVDNLEELWERKLDIANVTPATKKSFQVIVDRYKDGDRGLTTLPRFVDDVDYEVKMAHQAIDYPAFCKAREIPVGGCELLRDMAGEITGRDLVAYGMTELLPSQKGKVNVRLMRVILASAGSEYLNSLPALGDPLLSSGFYQFTSYAVRHDTKTVEGASKISLFADEPYKIPGSVVHLKGNDHHRAAFYFAVYNIATWIRHSSPEQKRTMRKIFPKNMGEVAQFMAVAHHLPRPAMQKAKAWVDGGGRKSLISYLGPKLKLYAKKTKSNRAALDEYLEEVQKSS